MSKRRRKARIPKRAATKRKSSKSRPTTSVKRAHVSKPRAAHTAAKVKKAAATPKSELRPELRRRLRAKRAQLSADDQRHAADRLLVNLAATRLFRVSRRIACYLPSDGEIDPSPIVERLWRMRKQAFLPVLAHLSHDRLWFAPAQPGMELRPNRFGIPEPQVHIRELVRAEDLDLILLPLVAFDAKGNRLGRGAGFYDRSLAFLRLRRHMRKPRLLGLGHDFQRVPRIPAEPWDVPLDGVVTDRTVYYTNL